MRCCLVRENGSVIPLPRQDGSEQYYIEPMIMPEKLPGAPTHFINPMDVVFERYPVTAGSGAGSPKTEGFVYAKRQPSESELAAALACLESMKWAPRGK